MGHEDKLHGQLTLKLMDLGGQSVDAVKEQVGGLDVAPTSEKNQALGVRNAMTTVSGTAKGSGRPHARCPRHSSAHTSSITPSPSRAPGAHDRAPTRGDPAGGTDIVESELGGGRKLMS